MSNPNEKFLKGLSAAEEQDLIEAMQVPGADEDGIASGNEVAAEDLRRGMGGPTTSFPAPGTETKQ